VKAPPGILFLWGAPVRAGATLQTPNLFDIGPTALYLLGLPVGRDMDGRVLTEAFSRDLLSTHPVAWVPSHDEGTRTTADRESPVDEQVLRELRSLGYVP
jgi:hypothetical protein